uniref:Uncharacterized protein n=1 Tax=Trichogramma kaykai TaxID=54128 RepID=A0ABD2X7F9_9HYME
MSTLVTFCSIVAALNGIILLGSVSPASAHQSIALERDIGENFLVFSESAIENTTVYYGICGRAIEQAEKECIVRRVQANFLGGNPKEDECNVVLRSESGGFIAMDVMKIDPLGKNRAIVRWVEDTGRFNWRNRFHLRFSIVDFSNCQVKTTKVSKDLDQHIKNIIYYTKIEEFKNGRLSPFFDQYFNKPIYKKGENSFQVLSPDDMVDVNHHTVNRSSIDADGVVAKVDTLLTSFGHSPGIVPLSEDKDYLLFETPIYDYPENPSLTVALIQPNGQRQNLTHIENAHTPLVSLANEVIGICARQNETTVKCTQFKLGDKEINWFSASIVYEGIFCGRTIYNLPRGEGFLTHVNCNQGYGVSNDKYLVKIGLDGKAKQFVDPDMKCQSVKEAGFTKLFEDDRGNYCLSTACAKVVYHNYGFESSYVKLHSKCFEPKDFKNVSKYDPMKLSYHYDRVLVIE